ncbi:transposase [Zunongwangia profunda]|uniref:transposase n=1 Tax=Zunongwangia profunda TaxID=398743 RepID=UPI003CD0D068
MRKVIYTTNTVERFHRRIKKVTKPKGAFPNDISLLKLVYLATRNIEKKWTAHFTELEPNDTTFLY